MRLKNFLPAIFFLTSFSGLFSQAINPVKWSFEYKQINTTEAELIITALIEKQWHIYSQTQNNDGPIPSSFSFVVTPDYDLKGKVLEPEPEKSYSEVFGTDVVSFKDKAVFKQKIIRNNKASFEIKGELEFMACNDSMCLPPRTVAIQISVPPLLKVLSADSK